MKPYLATWLILWSMFRCWTWWLIRECTISCLLPASRLRSAIYKTSSRGHLLFVPIYRLAAGRNLQMKHHSTQQNKLGCQTSIWYTLPWLRFKIDNTHQLQCVMSLVDFHEMNFTWKWELRSIKIYKTQGATCELSSIRNNQYLQKQPYNKDKKWIHTR